MRIPIPRLYMGTMTFAWTGQTSSVVDEVVALEMVKKFIQHNEASGETNHLIDTALVYAAGKTEPMVGAVLQRLSNTSGKVSVGTKANPAIEGGLSKKGIQDQVQTSLDAMKLSTLSLNPFSVKTTINCSITH